MDYRAYQETILDYARHPHNHGHVEAPDIAYEDIGGLYRQIEQIRDAVELPFLHADLYTHYKLRPPKGVLLYGPPGCGKTLIAKAVANSLAKQVAAATGELERAARLWGAARNLQTTTGTALADYVSAVSTRFGVQPPDQLLPSDVLERLAAEGAAMSLDEVVAYALDADPSSLPGLHETSA